MRAHVTPSEAVGAGLLFFKFSLDQPQAIGPEVTDTDVAFEIDVYVDWKVNANFTVSFVGAFADPGNGGAAVDRSHQELRLRDGLRRLQLLSGMPQVWRPGNAWTVILSTALPAAGARGTGYFLPGSAETTTAWG